MDYARPLTPTQKLSYQPENLVIDSNEWGYRKLASDGDKYNYLIAKPKGTTINRSPFIIPHETVGFMVDIIHRTLWQTKALAQQLRGRTEEESLRNVFTFLHDNIQYKLDEKGKEQLRQPIRSWHDRHTGIDCDCFTIFACSLLTHLGFKPLIEIAGYKNPYQYQHVYAMAKKSNGETVIIDPVLHAYNVKKPPLIFETFTIMTQELGYLGEASRVSDAEKLTHQVIVQQLSEMIQKFAQHGSQTFADEAFDAEDIERLRHTLPDLIHLIGTTDFEAYLNQLIQGETELQGLGATAKPKKPGVKQFLTNVKNAVAQVKEKAKNVAAKATDLAKDALHVVNRANPVMAASRGLVIAFLEHDILGLASLFWKHLSQSTSFGKKILSIWELGGGKADNFKEACEKGTKRKSLKGDLGVLPAVAAVVGAPGAAMMCDMVVKGIEAGVVKLGKQGITTAIDATAKAISTSKPLPQSNIKTAAPVKNAPITKPAPKPLVPVTKPAPTPKTFTKGGLKGLGEGGEVQVSNEGSASFTQENQLYNEAVETLTDTQKEEAERMAADLASGKQPTAQERPKLLKTIWIWLKGAWQKVSGFITGEKPADPNQAVTIVTDPNSDPNNALQTYYNTPDGADNKDASTTTQSSSLWKWAAALGILGILGFAGYKWYESNAAKGLTGYESEYQPLSGNTVATFKL